MKKTIVSLIVLILATSLSPLSAKLNRKEKKAAKASVSGTYYLKVDAPCATGRHPYGTYTKAIVEASPEGLSDTMDTGVNASVFHADTTYWGIKINDPVFVGDLDFDDGEVAIELLGQGGAEGEETKIKLTGIQSLEDFSAAFIHLLADHPLQDDHDDWSPEMKEAVSGRTFLEGMTKRHAFYIAGKPIKVEKNEAEGVVTETWYLRPDNGIKLGYLTAEASPSGFPEWIRFVDGELTATADGFGSTQSAEFSLD